MTVTDWIYQTDATIPSWAVDWRDNTGTLLDFTNPAWTFGVTLINSDDLEVSVPGATITPHADPTVSPNVVVSWIAGNLDQTPGDYRVKLRAELAATGSVLYFKESVGQVRRWPVITIETPSTPATP